MLESPHLLANLVLMIVTEMPMSRGHFDLHGVALLSARHATPGVKRLLYGRPSRAARNERAAAGTLAVRSVGTGSRQAPPAQMAAVRHNEPWFPPTRHE